jgi:hypothetical protein
MQGWVFRLRLAISLISKDKIYVCLGWVGGLFMKYNTHVPKGVGSEKVLPPQNPLEVVILIT